MRELTDHEIDAVSGGAAAINPAWAEGLQPYIDWTSVPRVGSPAAGGLISPTVPVIDSRSFSSMTPSAPMFELPPIGAPGGWPGGIGQEDERAGGS